MQAEILVADKSAAQSGLAACRLKEEATICIASYTEAVQPFNPFF